MRINFGDPKIISKKKSSFDVRILELVFRMKQEPLVWKHFDQLVLHDLENAKNAKQKRQIIKCALSLEKRDWNNKGDFHI